MARKTRPVRVIAVHVLMQVVVNGRSLSEALKQAQPSLKKHEESSLLQEMSYGCLRWFNQLDAVIDLLLKKPLKERDQDIFYLLLVGLYQLNFMRIPPHAVVKETVNACQIMGKGWAKGLVNALLRGFQRDGDSLLAELDDDREALYSHPLWMIEQIESDWQQEAVQILQANNQRPPMVLRVNSSKISRDGYARALEQSGIEVQPHTVAESALVLDKPMAVTALPGFEQGHFSVQDAAAQLVAPLLKLEPGQRVLDACAAPGGKTTHLREICPELSCLHALDIDELRLQQVQENLDRLQLQADLLCGDAALPDSWWDGKLYDRILLDVPCSGTGVIRRHPDIKSLRRKADIDSLVDRQSAILNAVWPLLAPGGILLYSTCSIFRPENDFQVRAFIEGNDDASERMIVTDWGHPGLVGRQILPGETGMDGFYFARLEKNN